MKRLSSVIAACFLMSVVHAADMSNSMELTQLYIIGSATPYQWDVSSTPDMERVADGVFRWSGRLEAGGEFKFVNTREFHKHILATAANQSVAAGNTYHLAFIADWTLDGSRDLKFIAATTGEYTIHVDLNTMMMSVCEKEEPVRLPSTLYATGSALGGEVVSLPLHAGAEFKTALQLRPGSLVIRDTHDVTAATTYYLPLFDGVDISFGEGYTSSLTTAHSLDGREGWSVTVAGTYTLYGILVNSQIFARPFKPCKVLYLVGGCCPLSWNYWSDPASISFTPKADKPEELVWEGVLKKDWSEGREEADKLKILTAQNWQSVNFHPYVADQPLLGESSYRSTGGPDIKWTIDRNGTYRITVNTALETIRGELIGDTNGRAFSQSVTSIDGQQTASGITVTSDGTAVTVSSSHEVAHVRIISANGAVTATGIATDNPYVSHPLPHGIYIVCASTQTGIIRHKVAIE